MKSRIDYSGHPMLIRCVGEEWSGFISDRVKEIRYKLAGGGVRGHIEYRSTRETVQLG